MVTRKNKIIAGSGALVLLAAAGTWYGFSLFATQGQGVLAQAPLNKQVSTTPALIMAVDDSGSMTFQTQFRGQDGETCWSYTRNSFHNSAGQLNNASDITLYDNRGRAYLDGYCSYYYVLPGDRVNNYYGVPQLDIYGFARSSTYNPTYFDPTVKYEPWMRSQGTGSNITFTTYPQASKTATLIDPRGTATINLTANRFGTTAGDAVLLQRNMVIPSGVRYRTMVVNDNGQVTSTGGIQNNTGRNGTTWNNNATRASIEYVPATFFMPWTDANDPRPQLPGVTNAYGGVSRVKVDNACGPGCPMWKYTIASTNDAAIQNFANWYSFYGNRNRAMIAGMTRAMNVERLYASYFKINDYDDYDSATDAAKRLTVRDLSNPADKAALYAQLIALTASGGTPNRQAVNSAGMQFQRTDAGAPIKASCQKNAVMLFTDGFSNNDGPEVGNNDQNLGIPFADSHSNTMADIVSQYYNSPLRTDDAMPRGLVPVPEACASTTDKSIDCNKDLHINFYGITLGARGNLYNPDNPQNPYTTPAIYENWPSRQNNNNSTVDDIWHASVNTRGEYINAKTPADITDALKRVLTAVSAGAQLSGGQGLTGARIGAGSLTVTPSYNIENQSTDWSSTLQAARVSINTDRTAAFTNTWEASAKLATQSVAGRRIVASKRGVATTFDANNISLDDLCSKPGNLYSDMRMCTAAQVNALTKQSSTALSDAIAYLRGNTAMEVRNSGGIFRSRSTILGDIVNSSPVIASPLDDYGYRRLGGDVATSYGTFLTSKREDARYMVYVGANDGMLHAFDGGMNAAGTTDDNGGTESFAYIPATALGHMGMLLFPYVEADKGLQKFQHRYYVDGPITVADAQVDGEWATTLVGTTGAGGRAVFGLDVTTPGSFGTGDRLWEISDVNMDLAEGIRNNIGHVLNKPVIVPVKEGDGVAWKAIFGNGVNSANGRAVLFVVDMSSGEARMIEAVEDSATAPAGTNGLNSILVVDRWRPNTADNPPQGQEFVRGRDGLADTVYGADQRGAVWKFDLTSNAESISVPLFTSARQTDAQNVVHRQPIMGGMTAVTGLGDGVMLLFGTGSFSFDGEQLDTTQQALYGVNDINVGQPATTLTPANLFPYTVEEEDDVRTLAAGTFTGASSGWRITLPGSGERFVGNPTVSSGIVFMPTYLPSPPQSGCGVDGNNWLFGLSPLSGSAALSNVRVGSPNGTSPGEGTAGMKLNTGGSSPVKDVNVAVVPRPEGGGAGPGGHACWMVVNVAGSAPLYMPYPCGRQSWRQVQ